MLGFMEIDGDGVESQFCLQIGQTSVYVFGDLNAEGLYFHSAIASVHLPMSSRPHCKCAAIHIYIVTSRQQLMQLLKENIFIRKIDALFCFVCGVHTACGNFISS